MMRAPAGRQRRSGHPSSFPTGAARWPTLLLWHAKSSLCNCKLLLHCFCSSTAWHGNLVLSERKQMRFEADKSRFVGRAGCEPHIQLGLQALGQLHSGGDPPRVVARRVRPPHQRPRLLRPNKGVSTPAHFPGTMPHHTCLLPSVLAIRCHAL